MDGVVDGLRMGYVWGYARAGLCMCCVYAMDGVKHAFCMMKLGSPQHVTYCRYQSADCRYQSAGWGEHEHELAWRSRVISRHVAVESIESVDILRAATITTGARRMLLTRTAVASAGN